MSVSFLLGTFKLTVWHCETKLGFYPRTASTPEHRRDRVSQTCPLMKRSWSSTAMHHQVQFPVLNPPPFPSRILHRRRISQALQKLTLALMRCFMEQMIRFNPGIRTRPGRLRCSPLRTIEITRIFGCKLNPIISGPTCWETAKLRNHCPAANMATLVKILQSQKCCSRPGLFGV